MRLKRNEPKVRKLPMSGYSESLDGPRLRSQLERLKQFTIPGQWYTLAELARAVGASEAGVSARLRDLRKQKFGGFTVEARRRKGADGFLFSLWEYRVLPPTPNTQLRLL